MPRIAAFVVAAVASTALLAGCLQDSAPRVYHAAGTNGNFVNGFAYDGKGVVPFDGFVTIEADNAANTGKVLAFGNVGTQTWRIDFDHFAQQGNKAFQDGGIAMNLMEHGSTGNGDTSIPKVHADSAGWGDARVTVNGIALPDALTGDERWVAHYMVLTTGVRDDTSKAIKKSSTDAPYDPNTPDDGRTKDGDNEILLLLKSHATAPPNATVVDNKSTIDSPIRFSKVEKWPNAYQESNFTATLSLTGAAVPETSIQFTFKDPQGKTIGQPIQIMKPANGDPQPQTVTFKMGKGTYSCGVSGNAYQGTYEIKGTITPPGNVVMNLWWEDVVFGPAAESFATHATNTTMPTLSGPAPT